MKMNMKTDDNSSTGIDRSSTSTSTSHLLLESILKPYIDYLSIRYQNRLQKAAPYISVARDYLRFIFLTDQTLHRSGGAVTDHQLIQERINLQTLTAYMKHLLQDRKQQVSTVNTTATRLRLFLRYMGKDREAELLPVPSPAVSASTSASTDTTAATTTILFLPEDVIIDILSNHIRTDFDLALIQTMYFFALRRAEVPLLMRDWIDHEKKTLKIYRVKTRYPWQILPFTEPYSEMKDTYGVLMSYIISTSSSIGVSTSEDGGSSSSNSSNGDGDGNSSMKNLPIFLLGRTGLRKDSLVPVSIRTVDYRVVQALKYAVRSGCKNADMIERMLNQKRDISTHIFRHSRATNMIIRMIEKNEPVSLFRVQSWLGHKMQQHTTRYIHLAAAYLGIRPEEVNTIQ